MDFARTVYSRLIHVIMILRFTLFLLAGVLFNSCDGPDGSNTNTPTSTTPPKTDTVVKTLFRPVPVNCSNYDREAQTFLDKTRVFEKADSLSTVSFTLPFNSEFQILEFIDKDQLVGSEYVEIKDAEGRTGFIIGEELPQNKGLSYHTHEVFLVNRYPLQSNTVTIRKADEKGHQVTESYTLHCSATYSFTEVYSIPLKGFEQEENKPNFRLFKYETAMNACPGQITTEFLYYDGKQLRPMIHGESEGEYSYYHSVTPYLPYRCGNGKIIHLANADVSNAFDSYEGRLRTVEVPKKMDPLNTIVVISEDVEYALDAEGEIVADKNGQSKKSFDSTSVVYYSWTGTKLIKLKMK